MTSYAHSYVHPSSIGDTPRGEGIVDGTLEALTALYEAGRIRGYEVYLIEDSEDAEEVLAHIYRGVTELTEGRFPYVFARVQAKVDVPEDIDGLMEQRGFALVASS